MAHYQDPLDPIPSSPVTRKAKSTQEKEKVTLEKPKLTEVDSSVNLPGNRYTLSIIDGVPLFDNPKKALLWGKKYGLEEYHIHHFEGKEVGYMAGSNHKEVRDLVDGKESVPPAPVPGACCYNANLGGQPQGYAGIAPGEFGYVGLIGGTMWGFHYSPLNATSNPSLGSPLTNPAVSTLPIWMGGGVGNPPYNNLSGQSQYGTCHPPLWPYAYPEGLCIEWDLHHQIPNSFNPNFYVPLPQQKGWCPPQLLALGIC